jgi:hypothetical protein
VFASSLQRQPFCSPVVHLPSDPAQASSLHKIESLVGSASGSQFSSSSSSSSGSSGSPVDGGGTAGGTPAAGVGGGTSGGGIPPTAPPAPNNAANMSTLSMEPTETHPR